MNDNIINNYTDNSNILKFYIALQGNKSPKEYIEISKVAEDLGFDRIYIYDDLMYKPSWPILNLIGEHTNNIQLGPCLVNGFYSHPALIAENITFLDELTNGRAILGVGRGAFFDFLEMPTSEEVTRKGCIETIQLVKRFLAQENTPFKGEHFSANENAVLRFTPIRKKIPIVLGSWNEKMALVAGEYCDELQVAASWDLTNLNELYNNLLKGTLNKNRDSVPAFSIGGMSCISNNKELSYSMVKDILSVYLPYLSKIVEKSGYDINSESFKQLVYYSKIGNYEKASSFISNELIENFSLSGTPSQAVEQLYKLNKTININGILFSPPFGTSDSIIENLELIKKQVISELLLKLKNNPYENKKENKITGINNSIKIKPKLKNIRIKECDCIIIGGGLASLTCALSLIQKGKKPLIIEKNDKLGGCQGVYKKDGFHFEPNMHSMAEAGNEGQITKLFTLLEIQEANQFIKLDPTAQFIFPHKKIVISTDFNELLKTLKVTYPTQSSGIESIFTIMSKIYNGVKENKGNTPLIHQYKNKTFKNLLDAYITNDELQAILAGFWGWGFPPEYASSIVVSALTYSLFKYGNFLPNNGMGNLLKTLENKINQNGGSILFNRAVKQIIIKNGRINGVLLQNGEIIQNHIVISNIDAFSTFNKLLRKDQTPYYFYSKIKKLQPSLSAVSVLLGLKVDTAYFNDFAVNNMVYPGYDFAAQYKEIISGNIQNGPFCLTIPTLACPSLAPENCHILSIFAPVAYNILENGQWKTHKERIQEKLINMAEKFFPDLKSKILTIETSTPDTLIRYTENSGGAFGGWDFTVQNENNRPANKTPINGLWLTGHWTFPGPGTHNVMTSGLMTASMIF